MKSTNRPETTLIIASSTDGKLASADSNSLDRNKDWKTQPGIRGYLQQFYDVTSEAGVYNLVTGKTMAGTGVNVRSGKPKRLPLRLIVLDHKRDLTPEGINYLSLCVTKLILVCGKKHPIAKKRKLPKNVSIIYQPRFDRTDLLKQLHSRRVKKVTLQSAGKLNAKWVNDGLVDFLTIIIYPLLIGSSGTSILKSSKISIPKPLRLMDSRPFGFNYIALNYQVLNDES